MQPIAMDLSRTVSLAGTPTRAIVTLRPTAQIGVFRQCADAVLSGTDVYVAFWATGSVANQGFRPFHTATDTWGTHQTQASSNAVVDNTGAAPILVSVRADGNAIRPALRVGEYPCVARGRIKQHELPFAHIGEEDSPVGQ